MGRYERAAEDYRRFIALEDRAPRVLYKLALAYYRNGRATLAIDALRRAVAIDDRFTEAHYLLGMCLRDRKRDDEALRALNRAVEINPAFAAAREELADLYRAGGRVRESIEQLEALAALEPSKAERLISVGLAYARLGRTDAAILTLGRAAERFPEAPTVYTALGRVWLESAELRNDDVALSKALEALEPAAGRATASSETLALYGRALFVSGKVVEAERVLQQAVTRLPLDPRALAHLSSAAERLGHLAEGRDALIQYVSLVDDEKARRTLSARIADLSLRINDPARAAKWAQRAIDGENANAYSLGLLADAQIRLGQHDAARETLTQALAREPRNRTLLRLRQRLGT
jgi:tetratricopeptide (TPR) repeat protein